MRVVPESLMSWLETTVTGAADSRFGCGMRVPVTMMSCGLLDRLTLRRGRRRRIAPRPDPPAALRRVGRPDSDQERSTAAESCA